MYKVDNIDNSPRQQMTLLINDNEEVVLNLEYVPNQYGWYFDFTYNGTTYSGFRLCTAYNLLRGFRTWLPFGLRVDTLDNNEAMDLDDFINGYATLYVLEENDIPAIEVNYYAKI